jgi:DNA-directed RNA polymerase subunit M/transcription elongation factor TFIIS
MKFCKRCNNLLYINQSLENFNYYCKKCNFTEDIKNELEYKVYSKDYQDFIVCDDVAEYNNLCDDPALPVIKETCKSCKKKTDIKLYKCSDLTIINMCCLCKSFYKL